MKVKIKQFGKKMLLFALKMLWLFQVDENKAVFVSMEGKQYSCNPKYISRKLYKKNSDIKISVTGINNLFKSSDLKDDTIVIDIGLGDVLINSDNISYTPKTKGIGPLSIALLLENLVKSVY